MKAFILSRFSVPNFFQTRFWARCSRRRGVLFSFFLLLLLGLSAGAFAAARLRLFAGAAFFPMLFSGIPKSGAGLLSATFTFLLNLLIFLTLSFLLGFTVFGCFAVPMLVFLRGFTVGVGVSSFLWVDGLSGLGRSACSYAPGAAVSLCLFLLFALRSSVFSNQLRLLSFSSREGNLDRRSFWTDYFLFLCFAAGASLLGGCFAALSSVFFHS